MAGSHTGSARLWASLTAAALVATRGVMVSMTCPSVKASPCQRKCEAKSAGGFGDAGADDEPQPGVIGALRFEAESMPASAT